MAALDPRGIRPVFRGGSPPDRPVWRIRSRVAVAALIATIILAAIAIFLFRPGGHGRRTDAPRTMNAAPAPAADQSTKNRRAPFDGSLATSAGSGTLPVASSEGLRT